MGGCSSHEDELPYMQLQDSLSRQKKLYNMAKPKLHNHVSTMTIIEYILTLNESDLQRGWNSIDKEADKLSLTHGFDKLLTHFILKYMNETFPHVAPTLDDDKRMSIIAEITKMLQAASVSGHNELISNGFVSQQWFTKLKCSDNDIESTLNEMNIHSLSNSNRHQSHHKGHRTQNSLDIIDSENALDSFSSVECFNLKSGAMHGINGMNELNEGNELNIPSNHLLHPPSSSYSNGLRMFSLDEEMSLDDGDTPSASTPPPSPHRIDIDLDHPDGLEVIDSDHSELDCDQFDALMDQESNLLVDDILCEEKERQEMISGYIVQDINAPAIVIHEPRVYFDRLREDKKNQRVLLVQSTGLTSGCHEFVIQILKSDIEIQEIGIIGTADIEHVEMGQHGVWGTNTLGSRAVYGNELCTANNYGSVNGDGSQRSYIDLTDRYKRGWCTNDRIRVSLDLDNWTVQFFLNGKRVKDGGILNLEPNQSYHPMICFGGNCRYLLHNPSRDPSDDEQ